MLGPPDPPSKVCGLGCRLRGLVVYGTGFRVTLTIGL